MIKSNNSWFLSSKDLIYLVQLIFLYSSFFILKYFWTNCLPILIDTETREYFSTLFVLIWVTSFRKVYTNISNKKSLPTVTKIRLIYLLSIFFFLLTY